MAVVPGAENLLVAPIGDQLDLLGVVLWAEYVHFT